MKKCFKKTISGILTASMLFSSVAFVPTSTSVVAAATTGSFSTVGGWNESLYAEWADQNPDNTAVKVGYKLSGDANYTYLTGDDYTYLIRPVNASLGRVDIPGLKAGTYDLEVTSSDGTVYTQTGIQVTANDRSGYAFWNRSDGAGVGAYNDDGTPKDNAIIVYVTDENKDTVEIPGYEGKTWSYTPSTSDPYTRTGVGIGNILNNNMKLMQDVTITDNHPLIFRFVGKVNVPQNLTPYNTKDPILGGAAGDNGNLASTKYGRNITIEGIGSDATIEGWGFTFSQTKTCPTEAGKNFEVRNLTFEKYTEDALGFQGDDADTSPIERVWVHNNTFYPGYCAKPAESDKAEGDGSCDFKRGKYYTMSYNHYIKCHKTNLIGASASDDQYYITLHHNWYEQVGSRQPLAAGGNIHIYNTYFQGATSTTVDCRGKNATFLENNYYDNCKNYFKSRNNTCVAKSYGEIFNGGNIGSVSGTRTVATSRDQSVITDNGIALPSGNSVKDFDISTSDFYYDAANKKSDVQVLNATADVPAYVKAHAGVLSVGTASEDTTETTTSSKSDTATETTTTGTVTPSTGDSVKDFNDGSVADGYYKFTGTKKNIAKGLSKTYNGKTYTQGLKLESGTEVKFTPKNKGKLTLVTDTANKKIKVNGTAYTTDSDGVVTIDVAAATEYSITKGDSMNLVYLAVAEEASAEDTTEATTNQPIEATTVAPTEATTAKAEATTEATTAKATEATTKEATSETTTEETPAPSPSTGLVAGTYSLISIGTIDGIDISAVKEAKGSGIKVAAATEYLAVTPAVSGTIQLTWSSNKPVVKANDADVEVTVSGSIATFAVTAGTTYKIYSSKAGSNCTMTQLVLAESTTPVDTTSEATTETTTVTTTETTTVKATEATTKEATSETTTEETPTPTPSNGLAAGTYTLSKTMDAVDGIDTTNKYGEDTSSIKVRDDKYIAITPAVSGTIALTWSSNAPIVKAVVNGVETEVTLSTTASVSTFAVTAGTVYKVYGSKAGSNTNISQVVLAESATPADTTSESTSETTTEATTETTTVATTEATTETTTVTTTEATTETTTVATTEPTTVTTTTQATTKEETSETTTEETPAPSPVTGVNIVADSTDAKVGTQVTIPVRVTGLTSLASLDVNVAYDSSKVTVNSVSNGDVVTDSNAALSYNVANGTVGVAIANPAETVANGDVLFNLVVTPTAEGTATFTITVDEAYAAENQTIEATTTAGTLTIAKADPVGPTIVKGDADKNGLVEKNDVTTILNYVAGLISSTEIDTEAADVNEDGNVTTRDAYIIQKYLNTGSWN